ncbi:MAG: GrpB family protein [Patescibacteria group bacterium]|nr:GrpB family protein [Patescibacteria group bacterium]
MSTLGLKRGTVKLRFYSKLWSSEFEKERQCLLNRLGNLAVDVQHIGSTSVPGLTAKPILDMAIGVRRFKDARKLAKPLRELGYNFDRPFQHQLFFAKGSDAKRTHYVHVMRYNGAKWKSDALFGEYLRNHPVRACAYAALKVKLAKQHADERQKYSDGKDSFIKETLRLARER